MNNLKFPLNFFFKINTFANDFIVSDANETMIAFVRQDIMKLKSGVSVYTDETKTTLLAQINADKVIGSKISYHFSDAMGKDFGSVTRAFWSLWKSSYVIADQMGNEEYQITEKNPWTKVWNNMFEQIPLVGIFSGYLFHPEYEVTDKKSGTAVMLLKKESSFVGRRFTVNKMTNLSPEQITRITYSLMMMILVERRKG
jgi:hypothetical protein